MLYVITSTPANNYKQRVWHVGNPFAINPAMVGSVTEIQADGDELSYIFENIRNIPASSAPVQTWYGDHAKFIAGFLANASAI